MEMSNCSLNGTHQDYYTGLEEAKTGYADDCPGSRAVEQGNKGRNKKRRKKGYRTRTGHQSNALVLGGVVGRVKQEGSKGRHLGSGWQRKTEGKELSRLAAGLQHPC